MHRQERQPDRRRLRGVDGSVGCDQRPGVATVQFNIIPLGPVLVCISYSWICLRSDVLGLAHHESVGARAQLGPCRIRFPRSMPVLSLLPLMVALNYSRLSACAFGRCVPVCVCPFDTVLVFFVDIPGPGLTP